jgi:glutathione synthase
LSGVLTSLRDHDELVAKLWAVWETVRASAGRPQPVRCGIWRCDYMLHDTPLPEEPAEANPPVAWRQGCSTRLQLKQVEFNTFSCAGGVHGNIAAGMHRYLCSRAQGVPSSCDILGVIPENKTVESIGMQPSSSIPWSLILSATKTALALAARALSIFCHPRMWNSRDAGSRSSAVSAL